MNRTIHAIALAALPVIFAIPAVAQENKTCPAVCAENTCSPQTCSDKVCPTQCTPFAGIDLTADQQAKLKALKTKQIADNKVDRSKQKSERRLSRLEKRAEMLASIKDILTPEQYVKFLENSFVNGGRKFKEGKTAKVRRPDKRMNHAKDRTADSRQF